MKPHRHRLLVATTSAHKLGELRALLHLPGTDLLSLADVGLGQLISPPAPMIPPAMGKPLSTRSRMVIAAVCQPLAASPQNSVSLAPSASRWNGCGS